MLTPNEVFWTIFTLALIIPLAVFGVAEYKGIKSGDPYTKYIREWLGISPRRKGFLYPFWIFAVIWAIFVVWFPLHIACVWPWETTC